MKTIVRLLTIFCVTSFVFAQIDRTKQPKPGPAPEVKLKDPKIFELDNGLKVFVVENHKLPRVNAYLTFDNPIYNAGDLVAANDLIGSMLGEGTTTITKDEFNERIDFLGARLNFSANGATMNSLSKYYKEILQMMAEAIKNPLFTKEEFEKERQNLITGIKSNENDVETVATRVRRIAVYGANHPYAEFTTIEDAEKAKLEDIVTYYAKYYVPNNAYLIVAGDVSYADVKKLVEKEFSGWKKSDDIQNQNPLPKNLDNTTITLINMPNAVQSNLQLSYPVGFKMKDKDYLAVQLASNIFGGNFNSRLNMNLREEHGYTYGARGGVRADKNIGRFFANSLVRNEVTDSAIIQSMYELENFVKNGITEKELKNAKANFTGDFVRDLEDSRNQAFNTLNLYTENLPPDFYKNYLTNLNNATVDDVNRVIKKYFQPKRVNIVVTGKAEQILPGLKELGYPIQFLDKYGNFTEEPKKKSAGEITAKHVIDKFIEESGGLEKVKKIKSWSWEYNITSPQIPFPVSGYDKAMFPNKTVKAITAQGMGDLFKSAFNGVSGYNIQQGQKSDFTEEELTEAKENYTIFPQLYYDFSKVEIDGITDVDGQESYKIIVNENKTEYYSVDSGFLIKSESKESTPQGEVISITKWSDYKDFNGYVFPYSTDFDAGGQFQMKFETTSIKINESVIENDFN